VGIIRWLHRHGGHAEAVARIRWCISETALGVITGAVGAGKTVARRAALAGLDASRYTVIYLPWVRFRSGPGR
jgi:type II secretory pathway predicted ATPase ExeA